MWVENQVAAEQLCRALAQGQSQSHALGKVVDLRELREDLMPVFFCGTMLQSRNLLYTAVTRAKKMVILVGRADILEFMVKNNRQEVRYTCLCDRLRDGCFSRGGQSR